MDTRFVESLLAVVEYGSIVGAARAQSLTPAAVSQRIVALEREIGVILLERSPNSARATLACEDLLEDMRRIVGLARSLGRRVDPCRAEGVLRIGAISTVLTGLVPQLLPRLRDLAPNLEVRIEPGTSSVLHEALLAHRIDAALIVAPPSPREAVLTLYPVAEEPLCLIAPPGSAARPVPELFRIFAHVVYDPASWGGQVAQRYIQDHRLESRPLCVLDGLEAISALVRNGAGVSVVPRWMGLESAIALPDGDRYARNIVLAYPKLSLRPAAIAALQKVLDDLDLKKCAH